MLLEEGHLFAHGIESFLATKSDSTLMGQMVGFIIGTISARMSWFSRRDNRGGSIMIWLAFSWDRATPVVFVEDSITASRYKIIFSAYLTPMVHALDEFYDAGAIFQQDNARAHTAHATLDWLDGKGITVLDWPANSPDLNPTENVFDALARRVYAGNRQFGTVAALKEAIVEAWADIDFDELEPYIDSMPDRMEAVIASQGKPTRF
jgi:hypothetical protein